LTHTVDYVDIAGRYADMGRHTRTAVARLPS